MKNEEAEACPDHAPMLAEIPPRIAISSFRGNLKGKSSLREKAVSGESSLMIYEKYAELK